MTDKTTRDERVRAIMARLSTIGDRNAAERRYPKPHPTETVAEYEARCLHAEGRTADEIHEWDDEEWIASQRRINPSHGTRIDFIYKEDIEFRLGLLTGELRRIY